jgi:tripartite-type tricarboxylate transporter receptor subunit TctC
MAIACVLMVGISGYSASAEDWPTKMVRAIVPLTAGSATDIAARTVLNQVSNQIGQAVVIENRPGAGNTIGMAAAAQSDPDGYTILINSSSHTIVPATFGRLQFDTLRDFAAIIPLGNVPTVLVVSPTRGYKTLSDFIAAAKAKPGSMNYSTAGAGNFSHLATEVFLRAAGIDAVHIPSKGAPEAATEVLANRVDFFFSPLTVALPFLQDGQLQALAVSGSQRAIALPNVPTTREAGVPNSEYNFWVAVFAPVKTPQVIIDRLYKETALAVKNPDVRERLAKVGIEPMELSQADFAKLVRDEISLNITIATAAGLKIN